MLLLIQMVIQYINQFIKIHASEEYALKLKITAKVFNIQ